MCSPTGKHVVDDKDRREMRIILISRLDYRTMVTNAWHTRANRPFLMECLALIFSSLSCFFQFERFYPSNHVCARMKLKAIFDPRLTQGHPVPFKNGRNQIQERPHPLHPSWYFGMVYLAQEKTITYYPGGVQLPALCTGGGGEGAGVVKQSFWAPTLTLSLTASCPSPIKLFQIKIKMSLSSFYRIITAWAAAGRWSDTRTNLRRGLKWPISLCKWAFSLQLYTTQKILQKWHLL